MKGLLILANGFQDTEALSTRDVLRRSKIQVDMATINNTLEVEAQTGLLVKANLFLKDVKTKYYDFVIIPGGKLGVDNLNKVPLVDAIINEFVINKKLVAAICAGPTVVGKNHHYESFNFTCYPGMDNLVKGGKYQANKPIVTSGNFVTAKTLAYSIDFALEIVEYLQGKEQRELVYKNIHGEM